MSTLYLWVVAVVWIGVGLFIGTAGHMVPLGRDSGGWLTNAGFGVLGALIGGIAAALMIGGGTAPSQGVVAGSIGCVVLWRFLNARAEW